MRKMLRAVIGVCLAAILFKCTETDLLSPDPQVNLLSAELSTQAPSTYAIGSNYYLSPSGNDATGNGSQTRPWKTLRHAISRVSPNMGHTIHLAAGTYVESGQINIPTGININGAGRSASVIKAHSSFYYNPTDPGYSFERYLITLNSNGQENGNQSLTNFMIDGDGKKLHGGIYVRRRNNVLIENVRVNNTNFNGMWLWDVNNSKMKAVALQNCSWGSNGWSAGALQLGAVNKLEIDQLDVNEGVGYGVKVIGPTGNVPVTELKIHDSRISVNPVGLWNGGSAPNIAIEMLSVKLVRCEIYNSYVDNTISLVAPTTPQTGVQTIRVHHNTLDMQTRAQGAGYGIELTLHDAEIDHNYFIKGTNGIANWDVAVRNWSIHHNVFYGLEGQYPGEVVRSQKHGLHDVKLYNNTIEFTGSKTMNVIGLYGGSSSNIDVRNNLVINSNSSYNWYHNKLLHTENGATHSSINIQNNLLNNVNTANLSLSTLLSSIVNVVLPNGLINKNGNKPDPYYFPAAGSSLIDRGVNVGFPFNGSAPDIGAYESGTPNVLPAVSLSSPAANAGFTAGASVTIAASATDANGTVSKVEFFQGNTKLGEDTSSPYSFTWSNVPAGSYSITARATDNDGGVSTSAPRSITVTAAPVNAPPTVFISSPANGSQLSAGSTVTLYANAADKDGNVTKVEFFYGSTKIGEDTYGPFMYTWYAIPAGTHQLTTRAYDNSGNVTTSSAVTVTVTSGTAGTRTVLMYDASQAQLSGKMVTANDAQAGTYFYVPAGNGTNWSVPTSSTAKYWLNIPAEGTYHVWAKVKSSSAWGFHVYDGHGKWTMWECGVQPKWTWVKVSKSGSPVAFNFSRGSNEVQFAFFQEDVKLDQMLVTNDPNYVPN